jgi:hypothetical protein
MAVDDILLEQPRAVSANPRRKPNVTVTHGPGANTEELDLRTKAAREEVSRSSYGRDYRHVVASFDRFISKVDDDALGSALG